MPPLRIKPDASFADKIVRGAVGARAVAAELEAHGHQIIELERGALDTKIWKDVKRKRERLPDLVCLRCSQRVESRAKSLPQLVMSHSETDAARAWDYGLVDSDWVAFPVVEKPQEEYWSSNRLDPSAHVSYWHERRWSDWQQTGSITYVTVSEFRSRMHATSTTKGSEAGSETYIGWKACFASDAGVARAATQDSVSVYRHNGRHLHKWNRPGDGYILVGPGDEIKRYHLLAATVRPLSEDALSCPQAFPPKYIERNLASREWTLRFAATKIARYLNDPSFREQVSELEADPDERIYVRLEAAGYLTTVCGADAQSLFGSYLSSSDEQLRLEAAIALGECKTEVAVELLSQILRDTCAPYYLRSAAAWALGQSDSATAASQLVETFAGTDLDLRYDALDAVLALGTEAGTTLTEGLIAPDEAIAAGCAEAMRQQDVPPEVVEQLLQIANHDPHRAGWAAWLLGNLPENEVAPRIASLQSVDPRIHFATALLWSFSRSWIARRWEPFPSPRLSK